MTVIQEHLSDSATKRVQKKYDKWFDADGDKEPLVRKLFGNLPALEESERDVAIVDNRDITIFEKFCEFPESWSDNAARIVASKYFTPEEHSLRQLISRVVGKIRDWGLEFGYFGKKDANVFYNELASILENQIASFNSPVWFNVGARENPQCSACFINSIDDSMESILDLAKTEALIFKEGSGSGINLTNLRSSLDSVSGGGKASGPVSFMKMLDANAGVIKSGGRTRRSATMRILDIGHPDILDFIQSKRFEEQKAHALIAQGYDSSLNGEAYSSVFFQNANHSVRVTDLDMSYAEDEGMRGHDSYEIVRKMAQEAWHCGDPGIQFADTINKWHTCKADGDIVASNPCSEYLFLNETACNLASINLMKFARKDENGHVVSFDLYAFRHAVRVLITAMDIIVSGSSYPTKAIERGSKRYRTLGLGFTNLGAYLMSRGLSYDEDGGRDCAARITETMSEEAHYQSIRIARRMGAYEGWDDNEKHHLDVIKMRDEFGSGNWEDVHWLAEKHGLRNAQLTVIAPTGTISFMMDCESTGIEPLIAPQVTKELSGGGSMKIVAAECVELGLSKVLSIQNCLSGNKLDYDETLGIIMNDGPSNSGLEYPAMRIFETALGSGGIADRSIVSPDGHLKMMAAVQPFICGGISKTVNLPGGATSEDILDIYNKAHKMGLKCIAVYRDGSKRSQPLNVGKGDVDDTRVSAQSNTVGTRLRLPDTRAALTHHFRLGESDGYVTVGEYDEGNPGEMFIKVAKQGSTLSGLLDAVGIAVSIGLQHGVPPSMFVDKFKGMSFEPSGWIDGQHHPSLMSYIFSWFEKRWGDPPEATDESPPVITKEFLESFRDPTYICPDCGDYSMQTGTCFTCPKCGYDNGC